MGKSKECVKMGFTVWAVEGFFPRGISRGFSQNFFQGRAKSGEICFLPLEIEKTTFEIEKTTFFANNF